jgi:hypothetical protein
MNKYMKNIIITGLWALMLCGMGSPVAIGQEDGRKVLQQLIQKYDDLKEYNCRLEYAFFTENGNSPVETMTGTSAAWKDRTYFKIGKMETLQQDGLMLVLQHEEKYMILDKSSNYRQYSSASTGNILAQMAETGYSMALQTDETRNKRLNIYASGGSDPVYALVYDDDMNILTIVVYYGEDLSAEWVDDDVKASRLEIRIERLPPTPLPLEIKQMVIKTKDGYQPVAKWRSYAFHNLIE